MSFYLSVSSSTVGFSVALPTAPLRCTLDSLLSLGSVFVCFLVLTELILCVDVLPDDWLQKRLERLCISYILHDSVRIICTCLILKQNLYFRDSSAFVTRQERKNHNIVNRTKTRSLCVLKLYHRLYYCKNDYFPVLDNQHDRNNWAATWQNQQSECAPSEDSDQPGHPPSLIRVFAVRLMGS